MKDTKILYQIKVLDQLVFRSFTKDLNQSYLNKMSLTPSQMRIIEYIINEQNEVDQNELEKNLCLRRATISGILKTMEKNKLIERKKSDSDARKKVIILNKDTKLLFEKHKKYLDYLEKVVIKGINKNDLNNFIIVLKKMQDNLKQ